jgi:hypothetical protein
MSRFIIIGRYRGSFDGATIRRAYQEALNFFATWQPPEDAELIELCPTVDMQTVVGVWEATDTAIAVVAAQFTPWLDIEVMPVISVDEAIRSMVLGGLVTPPWGAGGADAVEPSAT